MSNNDLVIGKQNSKSVPLEHDGKLEGEIYVKGPAIFKYYFNKEEATRKAFDSHGYYMMGVYRILLHEPELCSACAYFDFGFI